MLPFFNQIFCCCFPRNRRQDIPDENSRLIPPRVETSSPVVVFVDHERLRDRLGTIVRAKEGKMVNVNSQIPFNLHNQTVSPGINPSSSRSTSMSTNRYAFHDSTTNPVNQYRQNPYPNVLITPVDSSPSSRPSRQPSRSPSPFVGENDAVIYPRNPILNVRLVGASGSAESGRTGRARERVGDTENKEPNTTGLGLDLGIKIPHDVGRGEDDLDATPRPHGGSNQPDQIDTKSTETTLTPQSPEGLKIHDIGAISLSWGD